MNDVAARQSRNSTAIVRNKNQTYRQLLKNPIIINLKNPTKSTRTVYTNASNSNNAFLTVYCPSRESKYCLLLQIQSLLLTPPGKSLFYRTGIFSNNG